MIGRGWGLGALISYDWQDGGPSLRAWCTHLKVEVNLEDYKVNLPLLGMIGRMRATGCTHLKVGAQTL